MQETKLIRDARFGLLWRMHCAVQVMDLTGFNCHPRVLYNLIKADWYKGNYNLIVNRYMDEGVEGSGLDFVLKHPKKRKEVRIMWRRFLEDRDVYLKASSGSLSFDLLDLSLRKDYVFIFVDNQKKDYVNKYVQKFPEHYFIITMSDILKNDNFFWSLENGNRLVLRHIVRGRKVDPAKDFTPIPIGGEKKFHSYLRSPYPCYKEALKNLFI